MRRDSVVRLSLWIIWSQLLALIVLRLSLKQTEIKPPPWELIFYFQGVAMDGVNQVVLSAGKN